MADEPELCPYRWPLEDPNDEDLRNGITHHCRHAPGHHDDHVCACGCRCGHGGPRADPEVYRAAVAVVDIWDADAVEDDDMSVAIERLREALER